MKWIVQLRQRGRTWWCVAAAMAIVGGLTPLAVSGPAVAATSTTTTLTVRKGGDRIAPQVVAGLAGATFDFFAGIASVRPAPGDIPTATCVTGAVGTCSVNVPGRTGPGRGYWIIERSAPSGFAVIEELDTGPGPTTPTTYNGVFTGNVANGQSYIFPVATTGDTNRTARGSTWADRRDDPDLPGHCGLNIALLIDVSGSIAPFLPTVKSAANGFVDALTGTPSHIALYTFATDAAEILGPTPVSETSGADTVKAAINSLTAGGGTNWDAGLFQIAEAPVPFDAVIMLTDGNPTYYGPGPNPQGPGNFTRFIEVENGVFSANALKVLGTKVVAVGVGAGVSGSENNLIAISGPVRGVDFVQAGYSELAEIFRELALRTCAGTVTVVKKVIPPGGGPDDAVPAGGWTFSTSTPGVTPSSGETASGSGALSFSADLGGLPSLPVTLAETLQAGFTLVQQGGFNAECTLNGDPVSSTNSGALGFIVSAFANGIVSCVVLNEAPEPVASVVVNKTWVINGTEYAEPHQPPEFQAALQLTGQTDPFWGEEYGDYTEDDNVTVGEELNEELLPPGCTNDPSGDLGPHTLVEGLNTFEVVNTVTCITTLTLFKHVDNPYGVPEPPGSWTLSAYPPGSFTPSFSGTDGVTGNVVAELPYSMGESHVAGYRQEIIPGVVIVPPATGSWHCTLRLDNDVVGGADYDGSDGIVAVELGQHAECTAVNTALAAMLTLKKAVGNLHGGTAKRTDWILQAIPPLDGDSASPIIGRDGQPEVTNAAAVPNVAYTLGENSGPAGYQQVGDVDCVLTGTTTHVDTPNHVWTPTLGQDVTCTFSNVDIAPHLSLVKTVHGGTAVPTDWTLSATGGGQVVSGRSGEPAVTDVEVTAHVTYALSDAGGPRGYVAEGPPTCVLTGTRTVVPVVGGVVVPSVGQDITCTFHNRHLIMPVTGAPTGRIVGVGAAFLFGGIGLLFAGRRPRRLGQLA